MASREEFLDYDGFVEKFKPKKTTDDCYTPPEVYDEVLKFCREEYNIPEDAPILRPFKPGGDYQAEHYPDGCYVIDNPPFSILSEICKWYHNRNIKFFLFAPALTLFQRDRRTNYIVCCASVVYANKANVSTSFVTNLGDCKVYVCGKLRQAIEQAQERAKQVKEMPKYNFPSCVITPATLTRLTRRGIEWRIKEEDCAPIFELDAMKGQNKTLFGGGMLLTTREAREREAREREAREREAREREAREREARWTWKLSPREQELQRMMDTISERKRSEAKQS